MSIIKHYYRNIKQRKTAMGAALAAAVLFSGISPLYAVQDTIPRWHVSKTIFNHVIAVPSLKKLYISNGSAEAGDYLGAFYDSSGHTACAGYIKLENKDMLSFTVYGDDIRTTRVKEGFSAGEEFNFRVWKRESGAESGVKIGFDEVQSGDSVYRNNGTSYITSIQFVNENIKRFVHDLRIKFDDITETSSYKMIGLPGDTLISLSDCMIGREMKDWMAFYDDGQQLYAAFSDRNREIFRFEPGKAFWIVGRHGFEIDSLEVPAALPDKNTGYFSIPLKEGWNMISNPYNFPVLWDKVRQANLISDIIYYYKSGSYIQTSIMFEPYKGYYFYNRKSLGELKIPGVPLNGLQKTTIAEEAENPVYDLRITLNKAGKMVSEARVIATASALERLDDADQFAPPSAFEKYCISLVNNLLETDWKYLSAEARPDTREAEVYDLVVKAGTGEALTLGLTSRSAIPDEQTVVYLVDPLSQDVSRLEAGYETALMQRNAADAYKLVIGSETAAKEKIKNIKPDNYQLYQNYPNPFNPSTEIKFSLKQQGNYNLKVYNMLGQQVAELINGELRAGTHSVRFNASGLTSGVYFYELTGNNVRIARKMVFTK